MNCKVIGKWGLFLNYFFGLVLISLILTKNTGIPLKIYNLTILKNVFDFSVGAFFTGILLAPFGLGDE